MATDRVVLKIKKNDIFVNAEKNTDDDNEEHPGTVNYSDNNTLAEYKYRPEGGEEKIQYFRKQDDETWKRYLEGDKGEFDSVSNGDNIYKFDEPSPVPLGFGLRQGQELMLRRRDQGQGHPLLGMPLQQLPLPGGSKKAKKSKSKRPSKGSKKQKKQSKSRKQRR